LSWSIIVDEDDDGSYADEGGAIAAELLYIMRQLNGMEVGAYRIANTSVNRALVATDRDVRFQFDGTTIWYGRRLGAKYSDRWLDVLCYNKAYEKMNRTRFEYDYVDGASNVGDVMDDLTTETGLTEGTVDNHNTTIKVRFDNATCMDAFRYLAETTDRDFYTSTTTKGNDTINLDDVTAVNHTPTVLGMSGKTDDRSIKRDDVLVIGYDSAGVRITSTGSGGAGYEITYRESMATTQDEINNIAAKRKEKLNTSSAGSVITVSIGSGKTIKPGDTITLGSGIGDRLNLPNGTYKIWKTKHMLATVELSVEKDPATLAGHLKGLSNLENLGIYPSGPGTTVQGQQTFATDLSFFYGETDDSNPHNAIHWHATGGGNATITFADGSSKTITADEDTGLTAGSTYVYYIDVTPTSGNFTVAQASAQGDLDEPNIIPMAKIKVPGSGQTTQGVEIWPLFSSGLFDDPVVGDGWITDRVIVTPDFRTAWDVGENGGTTGVKISSAGVEGYLTGTPSVRQFYLEASTGLAYFGGGTCVLDVTGVTITSSDDTVYATFKIGATAKGKIFTNDPVEGDDEFYILADNSTDLILRSQDDDVYIDAADRVFIDALNGNYLTGSLIDLAATGDINLDPGGDIVAEADILPDGDYSVGTVADPWDEMHADDFFGNLTGDLTGTHNIPNSNVAGRPAAGAGNVWTLYGTREGAGTKGLLWVCMQNDANGYEWVQVAITT